MNWHLTVGSLVLAALVGCGGPSTGNISGEVKYAGDPVAYGTIGWLGAGGYAGSANIVDGKYSIEGVPVGQAKITLQSMAPPPRMAPPPSAGQKLDPASLKRPVFKPLPPELADATKSTLGYDVQPGTQTKNFDLPK